MADGMMPDPKPTDVPDSTNCKHDLTISVIVEGQSDMRECVDCRTTFSGRELAELRAASPVAPPESAERVVFERWYAANRMQLYMHLDTRLRCAIEDTAREAWMESKRLASPVAGGSGLEKQAPCDLCGKPMKRSGAGMHVHFADDRRCENRCLPELLRVQPSAEGWVKVTPETMPPKPENEGTMYLCWGDGYIQAAWGWWDGERLWSYDRPPITHWMPLPAPPAAEEERSSL